MRRSASRRLCFVFVHSMVTTENVFDAQRFEMPVLLLAICKRSEVWRWISNALCPISTRTSSLNLLQDCASIHVHSWARETHNLHVVSLTCMYQLETSCRFFLSVSSTMRNAISNRGRCVGCAVPPASPRVGNPEGGPDFNEFDWCRRTYPLACWCYLVEIWLDCCSDYSGPWQAV